MLLYENLQDIFENLILFLAMIAQPHRFKCVGEHEGMLNVW